MSAMSARRAVFDEHDWLEMAEDAAAVDAWDLYDMMVSMARSYVCTYGASECDLGGEG